MPIALNPHPAWRISSTKPDEENKDINGFGQVKATLLAYSTEQWGKANELETISETLFVQQHNLTDTGLLLWPQPARSIAKFTHDRMAYIMRKTPFILKPTLQIFALLK